MNDLRMLDLFSGIGGIALAAHWAGIETAAFVEIDPFCRAVLAKHWPAVPQFEDIRDVTAESLSGIGHIDIVAGGFPCQDVSLAGTRAGLNGQRSTLWFEFARLIREIRPQWVVGENVPGILSANGGEFMGRILRDLAEMGYDAGWGVWGACDVGAPHRRDRVFLVAHANSERQQDRRGHIAECLDFCRRPGEEAEDYIPETTESSDLPCKFLGDPQRRRLPGNNGRGTGQEPANGRESVADASRPGREEQHLPAVASRPGHLAGGDDSGELADAEGRGVRAGLCASEPGGERRGRSCDKDSTGANRQLESRLGGNVDGLPAGLVRGRFPARPGEIQYEWEPPRTATGVKHRARQLKAFGNAVMPQQIYPLFAAIVEASA